MQPLNVFRASISFEPPVQASQQPKARVLHGVRMRAAALGIEHRAAPQIVARLGAGHAFYDAADRCPQVVAADAEDRRGSEGEQSKEDEKNDDHCDRGGVPPALSRRSHAGPSIAIPDTTASRPKRISGDSPTTERDVQEAGGSGVAVQRRLPDRFAPSVPVRNEPEIGCAAGVLGAREPANPKWQPSALCDRHSRLLPVIADIQDRIAIRASHGHRLKTRLLRQYREDARLVAQPKDAHERP